MKKQILVVVAALVAGMSVGLLQAEEDGKGKGKGKGKGDPAKRAEAMLKQFDTDKSGTLSKDEFAASPMAKRLLESRGEEALDKVFASRDTNKDGQLDKAELSAPPKQRPGKGKGKGDDKGKKKEGDKASE